MLNSDVKNSIMGEKFVISLASSPGFINSGITITRFFVSGSFLS